MSESADIGGMKGDIGPGAADTEGTGRVLIIEDDPDMRLLEAITMRRAGWEVLEAVNGADGITQAIEHAPDVIVCDRLMPDLDGLEVIAALADHSSTEMIPVIVVTGLAEVADVVRGIDAGAHDYLVKPFELIELQVRCRAALRVSRAHRRIREAQAALAESEARYRTLMDHLPDTVAIVYDRKLNAVVASGAGMRARGFDPDDMVGRNLTDLAAWVDVPVLDRLFRAAFDGTASTSEYVSHANGVESLLDVVPIPVAHGGDPEEILAVSRDIGPLKARERLLSAAEQRWREAFESAPVGMAQLGLDGRIQRVNRALSQLLGYTSTQLEAMYASQIVEASASERVANVIRALAAGTSKPLQGEIQHVRADGSLVWTYASVVPMHDADGNVDHFLAHYLDVTDRKRHEFELEHLAHHDPLTGLLNRRGFEAALDRHGDDVARYGPRGALLVLDVDGLKPVNDTLGHEAGDELLTAVADALRQRLRASDVIGRLGGDEFAVILPYVDHHDAQTVAAAVVKAVAHRRPTGSDAIDVSASVGIAPFDGRAPREVLAAADGAMYAAKVNGGNRAVVIPPVPVGATSR